MPDWNSLFFNCATNFTLDVRLSFTFSYEQHKLPACSVLLPGTTKQLMLKTLETVSVSRLCAAQLFCHLSLYYTWQLLNELKSR